MPTLHTFAYAPLPYFTARDKQFISESAKLPIDFIKSIEIKNEKTVIERQKLVFVLENLYGNIDGVNELVLKNIKRLEATNTYTVVTAHQPNVFLGPLYFIYKILSAVKLAEQLNAAHQDKYFVPIYWMGSEDHDLEELNWISAYNRRWTWQTEQTGAVGRMKTDDLQPLLTELVAAIGEGEFATPLKKILQEAYNGQHTVSEATLRVVNFLMGKYGVIVVNQDDKALKTMFAPLMKRELLERKTEQLVLEDIADLEKQGFSRQATPRNINLFYHTATKQRARIVFEAGNYAVLNSNTRFSEAEILAELENYPERFSPNVVLRPVFQELVLPNVAYVGGGGELAYWAERRRVFAYFKQPFPSLVRRQSFTLINAATQRKMEKLGRSTSDIWTDYETAAREYIAKNAENELDLKAEKTELTAIFTQILAKATLVDATLEKSVLGEQQKIINGLEQLEQKIVRAEKRKHETELQQLQGIYDKLLPNKTLQERYESFIPYYAQQGEAWLDSLKEAMQPPFTDFLVVLE